MSDRPCCASVGVNPTPHLSAVSTVKPPLRLLASRGNSSPQLPLLPGAEAYPPIAFGEGWLAELSTSSLGGLLTLSSGPWMPDRTCCATDPAPPIPPTVGVNLSQRPSAASTVKLPPRLLASGGESSPQLRLLSGAEAYPPIAFSEGWPTGLSTSSLRELVTLSSEALDV